MMETQTSYEKGYNGLGIKGADRGVRRGYYWGRREAGAPSCSTLILLKLSLSPLSLIAYLPASPGSWSVWVGVCMLQRNKMSWRWKAIWKFILVSQCYSLGFSHLLTSPSWNAINGVGGSANKNLTAVAPGWCEMVIARHIIKVLIVLRGWTLRSILYMKFIFTVEIASHLFI